MTNKQNAEVAMGTAYAVELLEGRLVGPYMRGGREVKAHRRDFKVVERQDAHNIMPIEALNHAVSVITKHGTQAAAWYIGLFEGNYDPVPGDTAATFPTSAVECLTYTPATRPVLTLGAVAGGSVDNTASRAEFTFTSAKTIYGAFIVPSAARGGVTGPLLSAVRFATPMVVAVDAVLRVSTTFQATSVS